MSRLRLKSYKGRPVTEMSRDELIDALGEVVQKYNQSRLPTEPDTFEAAFSTFTEGFSKIAKMFGKARQKPDL